jgi:uncharacterized protein (DUF1501 family)
MDRRDFLKVLSGAAAMTGIPLGTGWPTARALAAPRAGAYGRTVIHLMLTGGADLRYLFAPNPYAAKAYAAKFWEARKSLYQPDFPNYVACWNDRYSGVGDGNLRFGIHRKAGWLAAEFKAGNVAIVANVLGSDNRRHDHSRLIVNTGDPFAEQYVTDRDGWGGRLVYAIGAARAVAVSENVSVFCYGVDPADRMAKAVHVRDARNFALTPVNPDQRSAWSATARALKAYYAQKRREVADKPADWPYRKFLRHEQVLRKFGDAIEKRLNDVAPDQPLGVEGLYTAGSPYALSNLQFGKQCANVYDSFVAADLFQMRAVSMDYRDWDTHRFQQARFEANIEDVFGSGKGLARLTTELGRLGVGEDLVYVFTTDFGRQLRANAHRGTDHGRGNYMIVVGRGVRGGVYGEMFPASEIQGSAGETLYEKEGADIEGRTSFDRVLAEVCDWVQPGKGAKIFPDAAGSMLEPGVDLSRLFTS